MAPEAGVSGGEAVQGYEWAGPGMRGRVSGGFEEKPGCPSGASLHFYLLPFVPFSPTPCGRTCAFWGLLGGFPEQTVGGGCGT